MAGWPLLLLGWLAAAAAWLAGWGAAGGLPQQGK